MILNIINSMCFIMIIITVIKDLIFSKKIGADEKILYETKNFYSSKMNIVITSMYIMVLLFSLMLAVEFVISGKIAVFKNSYVAVIFSITLNYLTEIKNIAVTEKGLYIYGNGKRVNSVFEFKNLVEYEITSCGYIVLRKEDKKEKIRKFIIKDHPEEIDKEFIINILIEKNIVKRRNDET